MAPPRLQELEIFMLIRENQGKKKDLDHLFYIKVFGQLIFNLFKLIWISVRYFPIWNKTKSSNSSKFKVDIEY
jgi:hypothetical protein